MSYFTRCPCKKSLYKKISPGLIFLQPLSQSMSTFHSTQCCWSCNPHFLVLVSFIVLDGRQHLLMLFGVLNKETTEVCHSLRTTPLKSYLLFRSESEPEKKPHKSIILLCTSRPHLKHSLWIFFQYSFLWKQQWRWQNLPHQSTLICSCNIH